MGYWEGGIPGWVLPSRYIGIARAQPLASPRFCVHPGTPGSLLEPSAHLGSSHSDTRSGPNIGEIRGHIS